MAAAAPALGNLVIGRLTAIMGVDLSQFQAGLDTAFSQAQRAARRVQQIGRKLTLGISLPLTLAAGAAIRFSGEYETALKQVEKTTNAPARVIAALRDVLIEMSEVRPFRFPELANLASEAAALGVALRDIPEFVRIATDLGVSTELGAQRASTALAKIAGVMGTAAEDFERLGSSLVELGNRSKATEKPIVDIAQRLAGTFRVLGATEAQLLGVGAAVTAVGRRAEAGASAVDTAINEIAKAVQGGTDELDTFARVALPQAADPVREFAELFKRDAVEGFTAFVEGLGRTGRSSIGILKQVGLSEKRVRQTLQSLAGAQGTLRRSIDLSTFAWQENVALSEEAARFYDRLEARLTILRTTVENVAARLGDAFRPAIDAIGAALLLALRDLRRFVDRLSELDSETRRSIGVFIALAAVIPPVIVSLGLFAEALFIASRGLSTLFGVLTGARAIGKIATTFGVVRVAVVGAIIAMVAAAAVFVFAMSSMSDSAIQAARDVPLIGEAVARTMLRARNAVRSTLADILDAMAEFTSGGGLDRFFRVFLGDAPFLLRDKLEELIPGLKEFREALVDSEIGEGLREQAAKIREGVEESFRAFEDSGRATTAIREALRAFRELEESAPDLAPQLSEIRTAWANLAATAQSSDALIVRTLGTFDTLAQRFPELAVQVSTLRTAWLNAVAGIETGTRLEQAIAEFARWAGLTEEQIARVRTAIYGEVKAAEVALRSLPRTLAESMRLISLEALAAGQSFDQLSALSDSLTTILSDLLEKGVDPLHPDLIALAKSIGALNDEIEKRDALNAYRDQIQDLRDEVAALGAQGFGKEVVKRMREFDRLMEKFPNHAAEISAMRSEWLRAASDFIEGSERIGRAFTINLGESFAGAFGEIITGFLRGTRDLESLLLSFRDASIAVVGEMFEGFVKQKLDFDDTFEGNFLDKLPKTVKKGAGRILDVFRKLFGDGQQAIEGLGVPFHSVEAAVNAPTAPIELPPLTLPEVDTGPIEGLGKAFSGARALQAPAEAGEQATREQRSFAKSIGDALSKGIEAVREWGGDLKDTIGSVFDDGLGAVSDFGGSFRERLGEAFDKALPAVKTFGTTILNLFNSLLSGDTDSRGLIRLIGSSLVSIFTGVAGLSGGGGATTPEAPPQGPLEGGVAIGTTFGETLSVALNGETLRAITRPLSSVAAAVEGAGPATALPPEPGRFDPSALGDFAGAQVRGQDGLLQDVHHETTIEVIQDVPGLRADVRRVRDDREERFRMRIEAISAEALIDGLSRGTMRDRYRAQPTPRQR